MCNVKCISVIDGVLPSQDLPSYRTVTEPFAAMYFIDSLADCISSWSLPTFFYFPLFFFPKGKEGRHLTCYDQLQKKKKKKKNDYPALVTGFFLLRRRNNETL